VSYGEERPAASGSNEAAYAQNRRVEIVYRD
jgi:peptidoglycan-associated lipoprotein